MKDGLCTQKWQPGWKPRISSVQLLSRVWLFATPWPFITNPRSLLKLIPIKSVMPSSHLILCHPLLVLPPIPPSIWVFSSESTLHMRWPKYWSFTWSKHLGDFPDGSIVICLPMQGTWVWSLVREDPTCFRATKPMRHYYWTHALEPRKTQHSTNKWKTQHFGPSFFTITSSKLHRSLEVEEAWITWRPSPTPKPLQLHSNQGRLSQPQVDKGLLTTRLGNRATEDCLPHNTLISWSEPQNAYIPLHPPRNLIPSPHPQTLPLYFPFLISLLLFALLPQLIGFTLKKNYSLSLLALSLQTLVKDDWCKMGAQRSHTWETELKELAHSVKTR